MEVDGHLRAEVALIDEAGPWSANLKCLYAACFRSSSNMCSWAKTSAEVLSSLNSIDEPSRLVDTMAAHMALKIDKPDILEIIDLSARVEHVLALLDAEIDLLQVEERIRGRVKKQMERGQRRTR